MKFLIAHAKIIKESQIEIGGVEIAEGGARAEVPKKTYNAAYHPDLRMAFDRLNVHLAIMAGYLSEKQIKDIANPPENLIENFTTRSFSLGKEGDRCVLSGGFKLPNGKMQNFNTPFYLLNEDQSPESKYIFLDDLLERLNRCQTEIHSYISGEKRGQLTMDFEEKKKKVKNIQVAEPEPENTSAKDWTKASPDAMQRVAEMDKIEEAEVLEETKNTEEAAKQLGAPKKRGPKKKVAQSAETPSGEIEE